MIYSTDRDEKQESVILRTPEAMPASWGCHSKTPQMGLPKTALESRSLQSKSQPGHASSKVSEEGSFFTCSLLLVPAGHPRCSLSLRCITAISVCIHIAFSLCLLLPLCYCLQISLFHHNTSHWISAHPHPV